MPTPQLPVIPWDDVPESSFEPKPPGNYAVKVASIAMDSKKSDTLVVEFDVLRVLSLQDGAEAPKTLGKLFKRFPYLSPIPPTASAEDIKKRKTSLGMFKHFYRLVTGTELKGLSTDLSALRHGSELAARVIWTRDDTRKAISYAEFVALPEDDRPTVYENITNFKTIKEPVTA